MEITAQTIRITFPTTLRRRQGLAFCASYVAFRVE